METPTRETAQDPGATGSPVRRHNLAFARKHIPPPPCKVLEVGCGDGELAEDLVASGYEVVALDSDPEAVSSARGRGVHALEADFLDFEAEPFDVLLFPRSLHHISPLDDTLDRAKLLLGEGGTLVADEFAFDRMDNATAAWFYGLRSILTAVRAMEVDAHEHGTSPDASPRERWLQAHHHDPALSPGRAMEQGIERRFELTWRADVCYLYRYFHFWMMDHSCRDDLVQEIFVTELGLVHERSIRPLGLQLVARKTASGSRLR